MKHSIIQYTVKEGKAAENAGLISDVFAQLLSANPKGIKYQVFNIDANSFMHIITFESDEANKAFTNLPAFQAFRANLNERLENPPVRKEVVQVGSYQAAG
jgi:quinol monooxygenase YgiN